MDATIQEKSTEEVQPEGEAEVEVETEVDVEVGVEEETNPIDDVKKVTNPGSFTLDMGKIFLLATLWNLFFFVYNMDCVAYYQSKYPEDSKMDFVYSAYLYFKDGIFLYVMEKIFLMVLVMYTINQFLGYLLNGLDFSKMTGGSMGSIFQKNTFNVVKPGETSITFEEVKGCKVAKKELLEFVDFLVQKEEYLAMGAELPRGALLCGPSGVGKTMIAKALANETNYNFIYVQGSDFKKPLVGLGPSAVKDLFKTAKKHQPCIIFIDEIDSIGHSRSGASHEGVGSGGQSEEDAILNTFLSELDGFTERGEIFVLGATNRYNVMDKALLRPKRFDRIIHFKLPTLEEREEILGGYFEKIAVRPSLKAPAFIHQVAKKTFGMSGAQIYQVCNESAICAVSSRDSDDEAEPAQVKVDEETKTTMRYYIEEDHIWQAIDYINLGKEDKYIYNHLKESDLLRTAYHECGHAIVAIDSPHLENPTQISIIPHSKGSLGVTLTPMNEHKYTKTKQDYLANLCMLYGGRVAESIFFEGEVTSGARNDMERILDVMDEYFASGLAGWEWMDAMRKKGSAEMRQKMEEERRLLMKNVEAKTHSILQRNREKILDMVDKLLEKEELYEEDLKTYYVKG